MTKKDERLLAMTRLHHLLKSKTISSLLLCWIWLSDGVTVNLQVARCVDTYVCVCVCAKGGNVFVKSTSHSEPRRSKVNVINLPQQR